MDVCITNRPKKSKEEMRQYRKEYYQRKKVLNPEKIQQYGKEYYENKKIEKLRSQKV